jgi:hypothetical protein
MVINDVSDSSVIILQPSPYVFVFMSYLSRNFLNILPGDQEGLFKLAVHLRTFFNSVIYNTATGYVLLVYLTNI